jgi:hypothetical protein
MNSRVARPEPQGQRGQPLARALRATSRRGSGNGVGGPSMSACWGAPAAHEARDHAADKTEFDPRLKSRLIPP